MIRANNSVKEVSVSAIITKADGTTIDLGEISKTKSTLLRRLKRWLIQFMS